MTAPAAAWRGIRRRILEAPPCQLDPDAPPPVHHPSFPAADDNLEALTAGARRARAAKAIRATLEGGLDG